MNANGTARHTDPLRISGASSRPRPSVAPLTRHIRYISTSVERMSARRRIALIRRTLAILAGAALALTALTSTATAGAPAAAPAPASRPAPWASPGTLAPDAAATSGARSGGHLVLPASTLGTVATSARADAHHLPTAAEAARNPGMHSIAYLPVFWTSTKPSQDPQAGASTYVARADTYWRQASDGAVSAELAWTTDWNRISLSATEVATCDRKAIYREVAPLVSGGSAWAHVLVNLPYNAACDWSDLEYVGVTSEGWGLTLTNGLIVPKDDVINRAMLHNNGVLATDSLLCTDADGGWVPLSSTCTKSYYTDPWSPAGDLPYGYGHTGMPQVEELAQFGLLAASNSREVTPGAASAAYSLLPVQVPGTGVKALWFAMDGYWYILEYRVPTGVDAWTDDKTFVGPDGVTRTMPGGGVVLTRTRIGDSTHRYDGELITFHQPVPGQEDTARHPGLEAGESYTAPDGLFAITVNSANTAQATVQLSFPGLTKVARWSGSDRYAASAAISARSFSPGVATAYVASGEIYTDALSGAPVAGMTRGPVLLTKRDELPSAISAELVRLHPGRVVILGGANTITDNVAAAIQSALGVTPVRWSGPDRFATSAAISAANYAPGVDAVYVASGRVFPDALSGAPVAGRDNDPMLLVDTNAVPASIATELTRLAPQRIVVLGGPSTVTDDVEGQLTAYAPHIERWYGADRFATSVAVTSQSYAAGVDTAYIASGRVYTDALSGAPVAGMTGGPVLLTDTTKLPSLTASELARLKPHRIVVLGGSNTISYGVQASLSAYVTP